MEFNDFLELLDQYRPDLPPLVARERFSPTPENQLFLQQCRVQNFDISTIINIALSNLRPKLTPDGATWEGLRQLNSELLH